MSRNHLLLITPIQIQDMVDHVQLYCWRWLMVRCKGKKKGVQNTNRNKKGFILYLNYIETYIILNVYLLMSS